MCYQSRTTSCRSGLGTSHFARFWLAGEAYELTRMYLSIVWVTCAKVAPQIRYNMHQTCFVRMFNNIKHRGDIQALWLLAAQKYACVLASSVCVKQCIVVSEYSCFHCFYNRLNMSPHGRLFVALAILPPTSV